MSSRYYFSLAKESDDGELRTIVRRLPMDGPIQIAFHREPSFFSAERVGALSVNVIAGRDRATARIVGFGSRSVRRLFVNGVPTRVEYLASLRALPEVRGGTLLARGYRALRELASDEHAPYCVTTILDDNGTAKNILTSHRGGLPIYEDIGGLNTYAVAPGACAQTVASGGVTVERGSRAALDHIVEFLNRYNAQFQFAPCHHATDFERGGLFPDFDPENFHVASLGGSILGVAGTWDQSRFKQTAVAGYRGPLSWTRPLYNLYASATNHPRLPDVGEILRSFYVSFVAVDPQAPEVLLLLLRRICLEMRERAFTYFLVGFGSRNPLCGVLDGLRARVITSRVYSVYWPGSGPRAAGLDDRAPHLEIATL